MRILLIGQRMSLHGINEAWDALPAAGHGLRFLYRGGSLNRNWAARLDETGFIDQIRAEVACHEIDLIYAYADRDHEVYRRFLPEILRQRWDVPVVFGFHNHHAAITPHEREVFHRAHGFILLNQQSVAFFQDLIGDRPTFCLPSLYLPSRDWLTGLPVERAERSGIHVAGGGNFLGIPPASGPDPWRYDYRKIGEGLSALGIHVHLYGKVGHWIYEQEGSSGEVERAYRKLVENSERVRLEGSVPPSMFEQELSKHDFFVNKGFLPGDSVLPFEHMNFQLRTNSAVRARLPLLVANGTDSPLEELIRESGAGIVYEDLESLVTSIRDPVVRASCREKVRQLAELLSFESWIEPLMEFFESASRRLSLPSLSQ